MLDARPRLQVPTCTLPNDYPLHALCCTGFGSCPERLPCCACVRAIAIEANIQIDVPCARGGDDESSAFQILANEKLGQPGHSSPVKRHGPKHGSEVRCVDVLVMKTLDRGTLERSQNAPQA